MIWRENVADGVLSKSVVVGRESGRFAECEVIGDGEHRQSFACPDHRMQPHSLSP